MSEDVNPRSYDSAGRRRRAAATRTAVLRSAREAFVAEGYARTTVAGVARAVGVSAEFVYKSIGAKPALLKAVLDFSIGGDDEPIPLARRPEIDALRALRDSAAVLAGYVRVMAPVQERVAPIYLLAREAAATDADAKDLLADLNAQRLAGMTAMTAQLLTLDGLRPGLTADEAADVLWTGTSVELFDLLVNQRGWSVERYASFVRETLAHALLR